jgi:hypothetical protein
MWGTSAMWGTSSQFNDGWVIDLVDPAAGTGASGTSGPLLGDRAN